MFVLVAFGVLSGAASAIPKVVPMAVPASSCSPKPYAYAGVISSVPAKGIEAVVTTTALANVLSGHVAGWIGVGSPKAGAGGHAEWLQVGVNDQAGIGSELYAEITQPGRPTRYLTLASGIAAGSSYRLGVVEVAGKLDVWQVLVNGKPATGQISLPGSGGFQPMAMGESWNGGSPQCNGFAYQFDQLRIKTTTGLWTPLIAGAVIADQGYKVMGRTNAGFTAISG